MTLELDTLRLMVGLGWGLEVVISMRALSFSFGMEQKLGGTQMGLAFVSWNQIPRAIESRVSSLPLDSQLSF